MKKPLFLLCLLFISYFVTANNPVKLEKPTRASVQMKKKGSLNYFNHFIKAYKKRPILTGKTISFLRNQLHKNPKHKSRNDILMAILVILSVIIGIALGILLVYLIFAAIFNGFSSITFPG